MATSLVNLSRVAPGNPRAHVCRVEVLDRLPAIAIARAIDTAEEWPCLGVTGREALLLDANGDWNPTHLTAILVYLEPNPDFDPADEDAGARSVNEAYYEAYRQAKALRQS